MARKKKAKAKPQTFDQWATGQAKTAPSAPLTKMSQLWETTPQPKGSPRIPEANIVTQNRNSYTQQKEDDFKWWINDKLEGSRGQRSSVLNALGKEYGKNQTEKESTLRRQMNLPTTRPEKRSYFDESEERKKKQSSSKAVQAAEKEFKRAQEANAAYRKRQEDSSDKGGGGFFSNLADFTKGFFTGDGQKMAEAGVRQGDIMKSNKASAEIDRALTRATNTALLGLPRALDERSQAPLPDEYAQRKGAGQVGDFIYDAAGYAAPASVGARILRGSGVTKGVGEAAKEVAKGNVRGNLGKIAKETAKEGAMLGGSMSLIEEAIRGGINPDQFDPNQAALNVGLNTVAGAALDPIISTAAPLVRNALRNRGQGSAIAETAVTAQEPRTNPFEEFEAITQRPSGNTRTQPPTYSEGTQRITHHDIPDNEVDRILNDQRYNDLSQQEFSLLATQQQRPLNTVERSELNMVQSEIDKVIEEVTAPQLPNRRIDPRGESPEAAAHRLDEMASPISYHTMKPIRSITQAAKDLKRAVSNQFLDDASDLRAIEKAMRNQDAENVLDALPKTGLPVENSIYKQGRMIKTSTARATVQARDTFQPLYQAMNDVGITSKDLDEYALALHARDIHNLNAQLGQSTVELMDEFDRLTTMRPKDMTGQEVIDWQKQRNEVLDKLGDLNPYALPDTANPDWVEIVLRKWSNNPNMPVIHKQFMDIQRANLQRAKDAGFLSEEVHNLLNERHPNYVSLARDLGDEPIAGTGKTKARNPIQRRKGGDRDLQILPITESAIRNHITTSRNIEKNEMMQTIAKYADIDTTGMFSEVDAPISGNTITAYIDGQQRHYEVPTYLVDYMESVNAPADDGNLLTNAGKSFANLIKKGSTHYNLPFHFVSAVRDSAQAALTSRTGQNPMTIAMGFVDSFFGDALEKATNGRFKSAVQAYEKMGGASSQFVSTGKNDVKSLAESLESGKLNNDESLLVLNPFKFAERFGSKVERGARLGEFRQGRKKGLSDRDAFFEAVDVMDYSKKGSAVTKMNDYIPYLNAAIQGNARVVRAMMENPVGFSTKAVTYITAPTVALYMSRFAPTTSEEQRRKIQNAPDHQKNMYWFAPVPNSDKDEVLVIPKPHFIAQLFANPVEHVMNQQLEQTTKSGGEEVKQALKEIAGVMMPPNSVAGLNTFLELAANKDFFTGYEIESPYQKYDPKSERYNQYTSEAAKAIGNVPLVDQVASPAQIDHVLRKSFGSLGSQALDASDLAASELLDTTAKSKTLDDIFGRSGKQFLFDETRASGMREPIEKTAKQEKAGLDRKEIAALKEVESATAYEKEFKDLNAEVKAIQEDTTMTAREKKDAISKLRNEQRRVGSSFTDWYNSLQK